MSSEILINEEAFINAINSINNIVKNLDNIKTEITNANEYLKSNWEGKSSKSFFKESENISNTFTDYTEGLTSLCEDLNTVLTKFSETDINIANNIVGGK